ncbi:MAG: hypothetical protein CBC16_06215 [Verrucomicrobia bacterium TMED56]|nr:MAG: hypothetical protein CBC16_06215 [Verrucomicrobia bacterium TMED56]
MSKIFSNGCSFLTPRPKDGVNTFVSKIIAENYNEELFNIAMGGRGNTRISFSTKVWCEQNKDKDVFAVIGWSSAVRNDYITDDGWKKGRIPGTELTWRTWKTLDNVSFIRKNKGWDIENNLTMNFLDNVFDLQNYFERKRIPYVMYNSLPNYFGNGTEDFNVIRNAINMDRFFSPTVSHFEFITDKNLIVSPNDPHPSAEGHEQWAKQLKEFIDAKDLRTI